MTTGLEWDTVRIYSISKKVLEKSRSSLPMVCRTATPISLREGLKMVKEYNDKGHVVKMQREGSQSPSGYSSETTFTISEVT